MSASLEQDRKTDSPTHAAPSLGAVDASPEVHDRSKARAPIDYSSVGAFFASVLARFRSIWTKRFVTAFLCGQLVALCITCTNVATNALVGSGWQLPTLQTVPLYFALFIAYTPYTIYKYGFRGWGEMTLRDGWRYFILAACDVEANFLVVKAYQYSDLLSCMLLNAWATPVCMFFTWLLLRTKFHWTQLLGVGVCIGGLALLVVSDLLTHKNWDPVSRAKGNGFMIAGATLYGFSNATEEFFVRKRPFFEVLGQLGMFGFIICGVQAAALEHDAIPLANWSARNIGLYMAYIIAMIVLYTVAPLIYRMASSTFYNLSLLGSSFYGLLFGLFLFHYRPYWLYFVAFIIVIVGLIIYFWHSTPEEQAVLNPQTPEYVKARREQATVEETAV